jgi:hypothetical protein
VALAVAFALAVPPSAAAKIFGTNPIPISVGPDGQAANGASGGATVSGDNRRGRLAAFHSLASNLVPGDTNGVSDVFVWRRPRGRLGLSLNRPARPAGTLRRASVGPGGREANGPSHSPSLDGSTRRRPRCVAFVSESTNLAAGDADRTPDVYVRRLTRDRTVLVSRDVTGPATDPSIDGACRRVAFQSGGRVLVARVGRAPRAVSPGGNPDLALDGRGLVWEQDGGVRLRRLGRTLTVAGSARNPLVSDRAREGWDVSFETSARLAGNDDNGSQDVYERVIGPPRTQRPELISAVRRGARSLGGTSSNGGVTAYAAGRGIVTFATTVGGTTTLYYRNNNTGNIDDLAHAPARGGPGIFDVAAGARANFVAFASPATGFPFDGNGALQDVFFKHLTAGKPL